MPTASPVPHRVFSLRSFFADQTINIVSSLGAFLILIGSLSFVVTTTNLFLAFLVVLIVHSVFAAAGFVFSRFPSFRFISRIYTAIFALLVPLVGFSGYRLVSGNFTQVSAPTVVAIAAAYAAIIYALLTVTQQFKVFGYLSVVALVLADLAAASSLHLAYWWWPVLLMPLAFGGLFSMSPNRFLNGNRAVLREPVRVLMYLCIASVGLSILSVYYYALLLDLFKQPSFDIRLAGACMLLALFGWTWVYIVVTKRFALGALLAYQLVGVVAALAYTFNAPSIGYGVVFTALASAYVLFILTAKQVLPRFRYLRGHMELVALVLVTLVPLLVAPLVPLALFQVAYSPSATPIFLTSNVLFVLPVLVVACALPVSIMFSRTDLRRLPAQRGWCWLLLLSISVFSWAYSVVVLSLRLAPVPALLALTLLLLVSAIAVRRSVSVAWSHPLDVIVLGEAVFLLLLSVGHDANVNLSLLLLFAVLSYAVVVAQRRSVWLFLPLVFLLLAFPLTLAHPRLLLSLSVVLPLVAVVIARQERYQTPTLVREGRPNTLRLSTLVWEWPPLAAGVFFGITFCIQDALASVSTVQHMVGEPFSVAVEMAALALVWYSAAVLARVKWWLFVVVGFAVAGLLVPTNTFWVLVYVPFIAVFLGLGISQLTDREWAAPVYIVAFLAAIVMARIGYTGTPNEASVAAWLLLGFAALTYIIGVLEDFQLFLWLAPLFAIWAVYASAVLGDLYRLPIVALSCAALGVGVGCLPFLLIVFSKRTLLRYSLPLYVTALAAAALTGVYGITSGVNYPFPAAIPDALLLYAVVAYAILVFERQPLWLWLVAALGVWSIALAVQTNALYLVCIGFAAGLLGLVLNRLILTTHMKPTPALRGVFSFSWGWPWYVIALVGAVLVSVWRIFPLTEPFPGFMDYALLAFALLAYVIGMLEDVLPWVWVGVVLALGFLVSATLRHDVSRLFVSAVVCGSVGFALSVLTQSMPNLFVRAQGKRRLDYILPLYTTALASVVLTAFYSVTTLAVNSPFYAALPLAFFLYALLTYAILVLEKGRTLLWLVAGCAVFATLLILACNGPIWNTSLLFASTAVTTGVLGLIVGRFHNPVPRIFTWSWPWYVSSVVAMIVTVLWNYSVGGTQFPATIAYGSIGAFIVLSLLVTAIERRAILLVLPVALVAWSIIQTHSLMWEQTLAFALLFFSVTIVQYVWRVVLPATQRERFNALRTALGLLGQGIVLLVVVSYGGLSADSVPLAHVGAGILLLLAIQFFLYGRIQSGRSVQQEVAGQQHWTLYSAGLMVALAIPWELSALRQTHIEWLTLAPATYLIVIAPFVSRDERVVYHQRVGQLGSILGSALLLLPTLWSSFSQASIQPTFILGGEALVLLLLGISLRVRFFVLSGAALVIVSAMHALFLPSLGLPPSLALTIMGVTLLGLATALSLARHRVQAVWTRLD